MSTTVESTLVKANTANQSDIRTNRVTIDGAVFTFVTLADGQGMHSLKQIHAVAGERYLSQKLDDKWRPKLKRALLAHLASEVAS